MDVVSCVEIASKHSLKVLPDQLLDHFPCPRVMVFVVPHGRGTHAPDVAILAVFSPSRLIPLDRGPGRDLSLVSSRHVLSLLPDPHPHSPPLHFPPFTP